MSDALNNTQINKKETKNIMFCNKPGANACFLLVGLVAGVVHLWSFATDSVLEAVVEFAACAVLVWFVLYMGTLIIDVACMYYYAKNDYDDAETTRFWRLRIAVAAVCLLVLALWGRRTAPKADRCTKCGDWLTGAYIVLDGDKYCLKDGEYSVWDAGIYDFYNYEYLNE